MMNIVIVVLWRQLTISDANMYNNSGRIELLNNTEVIINTYLHLLQNANRRCDYFADVRSLSVVPFAFEAIKKAMLESKATRATRLRFITEITKANISYCKNLMKYVEMHHLDGAKGNFGISDGKECVAYPLDPVTPPTTTSTTKWSGP